MIKCPLCGNIFEEEKAKSSCAGCGVESCSLIRCPNCYYEFLPDKKSEKISFLKKIFKKE